MNIFISYAREDQQIAEKLYHDIKNQGYHPWLDTYDLLAGQKWELEIKKALKESHFCLVLLSKTSTSKRGYVQKEKNIALEELEQFPESDIYLIPVRLDNCELPMRLNHLNAVDIFPHYEDGLNRLFKAFKQKQKSSPNQNHYSETSVDPQMDQNTSNIVNIYISYSHIDNDNQWVDTFANHLQNQITKRLGGSDTFSINWDQGADSDRPELNENIIKQIENADMLMIILSPGYLNSKKCARERNTFYRAQHAGLDKKLIVIEREQIESHMLPKEIQNERPHRFWIKDQNQRFLKILGEPKPEDTTHVPNYFSQIMNLSFEMKHNITEIAKRKSNLPITEPSHESTNALPPIFLAEVTDDLFDRRDELEQYLKQQGFKVVPQNNLVFTDAASCKTSMGDALEQSRVFVQLLGNLPGKRYQNQPGICRMQYDLARQANKQILSWRKPNLEINACEDISQKELLSGENVMAVDFEEFKAHVVKRAKFNPSARTHSEVDLSPDLWIFLNADPVDENQAKDIATLFKKRNLSVALPIWEGEESDIIEDMESWMLDSDGVIIVYGYVKTTKVRKQLRMCRNLLFRREKKMPALAIYEGKPGTQPPPNIEIPNLKVINCRDCLDESKFMPFFNDLKQGEIS